MAVYSVATDVIAACYGRSWSARVHWHVGSRGVGLRFELPRALLLVVVVRFWCTSPGIGFLHRTSTCRLHCLTGSVICFAMVVGLCCSSCAVGLFQRTLTGCVWFSFPQFSLVFLSFPRFSSVFFNFLQFSSVFESIFLETFGHQGDVHKWLAW